MSAKIITLQNGQIVALAGGTSGQVLGLDASGNPVWQDQTGGNGASEGDMLELALILGG